MRTILCKRSVFSTYLVVTLSSSAFAGNIVLNSNFGTGNTTDWTVNTSSSDPWTVGTGDPFTGDTYFISTGCVGAQCITGTASQQSSLSQTLSDSIGGNYTLSFEFSTQGNGTPNELDVLWDGVSVLDLGPGGTLGAIDSYELFTVTDLIGTGSDTLTFLGRQDPGFDALDNVCVSSDGTCGSASGVPEPSTLLPLGIALLMAASLRRRLA